MSAAAVLDVAAVDAGAPDSADVDASAVAAALPRATCTALRTVRANWRAVGGELAMSTRTPTLKHCCLVGRALAARLGPGPGLVVVAAASVETIVVAAGGTEDAGRDHAS